MDRFSVFTSFKKYSLFLILFALLLLSGCQAADITPIDAADTGWFDHYFVYTFSRLIKGTAVWLGGSYGWSIVLITLLIRLGLMPLMLKQMKNSYKTREKMATLKPEMDALKNKFANKKDKESQGQFQKEMMQLYQKHNFNPIASMGCLPMIIQFPILIGFYYAIRRTPEIASHTFMWFNLGHTDLIITLIATLIYFVQFKVTQAGMDVQQRKQMAVMGFISPVMIGMVSLNSPAALPLYWAVGGVFLIVQTLAARWLYEPKKQSDVSLKTKTVEQPLK